ncbi:hypothetical protein KDD93_07530 [Campylobacter sp. faydin G-24]|uniref:Uncharacterized protein n=1 Tax=Campylobacter anatolicus TaxID=2829105 RepID=A0ABS5HJS6_9BACT|nr:hypothetical protein [Campylobacter anatolicus]MBR8464413.1 hypothetical protein [Campylobacter anatolicus]
MSSPLKERERALLKDIDKFCNDLSYKKGNPETTKVLQNNKKIIKIKSKGEK